MCVRSVVYAMIVVVALGPTAGAYGQIRYDRGQNIQPVFEGWVRNADGTFRLYFGYMNRNWREELSVPVGRDNYFQPGDSDRGQPTFFSTRRARYVFTVDVPADWGDQDLVWTVTAYGRTDRAYGWLLPEREITERSALTGGSLTVDPDPAYQDPNQPPLITIEPAPPVSLPNSVTLIAAVSDDGLPTPRPPRPGQPPRPRGPTVTWSQYRGPGKVTFTPDEPVAVTDGTAMATESFTEPGTYVVRATATDGRFLTPAILTVTVNQP